MPETVLVFDFGTTYFKAAVIDRHGRTLAFARLPTPIIASGLRSEIDPTVFQQSIGLACASLQAQRVEGLTDVRAITFCTQANTFTLLDDHHQPATPLIVWNDQRTRDYDREFSEWSRDPTFARRSGIPTMGHGFTPAKIKWLVEYAPKVIKRTHHLCFLGDYFTFWLTGLLATDFSVAGISGLFDSEAGEWCSDWAGRVGADVDWFPTVVRSGSTVGSVLPETASALGLSPDCVVVMGVLDQYAGAMGVGNRVPGGMSETTGTVLATARSADRFAPPAGIRVFAGTADRADRYYHMTFGDVSAGLLEVYRNELPDRPTAQALDESLPDRPPETLVLEPRDDIETLRQTLREWAPSKPRDAVVACIYRTVARALRDQIRALAGDASVSIIRSAGGASRSRKWLQIKADETGLPVLAPICHEPTLLGAAQLAGNVLGWTTPLVDDARTPLHLLVTPNQ